MASSPSLATLDRGTDAVSPLARHQLGSAPSDASLRSAAACCEAGVDSDGPPDLCVGTDGGTVVGGGGGSGGGGARPSEVMLIFGALRERQRRPPASTCRLSPLPGIAEESESRRSSIRSSIDLEEAQGLWMTPSSGHCNLAYSPD